MGMGLRTWQVVGDARDRDRAVLFVLRGVRRPCILADLGRVLLRPLHAYYAPPNTVRTHC